MSMIHLVIPGEAVPQARPKFARQGNFVRAYDPEKSRNYKAFVRMLAAEACKGPPFEGAVSLLVAVYRQPPSSWSKTKIMLAMCGKIRPITKPDLSNSVKGIEDALKGLAWRDDAQVVDLYVQKWYSDAPRVEIEINEVKA
jgi:Holliday junction resolvase RusA-like endonuclease